MTTLENDTLELINSTSIEGHTGCMVSNVSFSFDIDDEVTEVQEYIEDSTIVLTPLIIEKPVNEDFIASPPLFPSQNSPLNDSCTQVIEESNGNNESIKHAIKPKKSCAARRLIQGNESAEKLVDLGEKKILLKKRYNRDKLQVLKDKNIILQEKNKILQEKNIIHQRIADCLEKFL